MTFPEPQADNQENFAQAPLESPATLPDSPLHTRPWLGLLFAILLLIGGGTALVWRALRVSQPPATSSANVPLSGVRVKLAPVQTGLVEDSSDFIASLESANAVNLQPSIQGQVTQLFVKLGQPVARGTAVIQVNPRHSAASNGIDVTSNRVAQVQLENARATLRSLQAQRLSQIRDITSNQQDYQKFASLATQGAVPRRMSEQYANQLATAKAKLGTIDTQIQSLQTLVLQAETTLPPTQPTTLSPQNYIITAPVNGTIGDIRVKIGDFVNPATPIATITQNQPLAVKISLPREHLPKLQKGIPVQILDQQGQTLGISQVFSITPKPDNPAQPIQIQAVLNNTQGQLKANQLVRARVIWHQRPGVLIPTTAVSRIAGETFVYVGEIETSPEGVSRLVARQKQIKLGNLRRNTYQVISGLQPNEKIIVSGLLNLRDGVPIVAESF